MDGGTAVEYEWGVLANGGLHRKKMTEDVARAWVMETQKQIPNIRWTLVRRRVGSWEEVGGEPTVTDERTES